MIAERYPELANLPLDEKRALLNELCEDIASSDQDSPDPRIVKLLEDRWEKFRRDRQFVALWSRKLV